ncbi:MAG: peptide deformylase [Candidatus Berkiella sp.]|jgi:peptide deformylase
MSVLKILVYPDKKLRNITVPVTEFNDQLQQQIASLFETMYDDEGCGLAANQVGLTARMFVMDTSRDQSNPICMINPEIIACVGTTMSDEGCLSFPGVYTSVERAEQITVRFQDEKGQKQELSLNGLAANCVQHELDHLNGILFIDTLSKLKKNRMLRKLEKSLGS